MVFKGRKSFIISLHFFVIFRANNVCTSNFNIIGSIPETVNSGDEATATYATDATPNPSSSTLVPSLEQTDLPSTPPQPTLSRSDMPTRAQSMLPSNKSFTSPSILPSDKGSSMPTLVQSHVQSIAPSMSTSSRESFAPSSNKSDEPSSSPSVKPTLYMTIMQSERPSSSPTVNQSKGHWNFIVFADWHGAESFVLNPVVSSPTNIMAYTEGMRVLNHIQTTYGGDLVILPGDTNVGKWHDRKIRRMLKKTFNLVKLTRNQAVQLAGENCYGTIKRLFTEAGYNKVLMCIGDHEIGGNPWFLNSRNKKIRSFQRFKRVVTTELTSSLRSSTTPILGNVPATPIGTYFENTSYAYIHKNALFITVDAFHKNRNDYFDRYQSSGGEGAVSCTVNGDHLSWFESLLIAANNDPSIKHIFVQAHIPILQPVRKINCSGQFMDKATDSEFWKLMVKYNVDVYFAGEVHATTASKDPNSNLIQVVSRANRFNNFLNVKVTDTAFSIMAYNEVGTEWRWNANYTQYGLLTVDKSDGSNTVIESSGILKLIAPELPLIHMKFEKYHSFPLHSRLVVGMKYNEYKQMLGGHSKEIRGVNSTEGMMNLGTFDQQYDAQIANVGFVEGINGKFALQFTESSRLAFASFGPFGQGEPISFSFFFKTNNSGEMILLSYANVFSPYFAEGTGYTKRHLFADAKKSTSTKSVELDLPKDLFLLTLNNGKPYVYTSHKRYITLSNFTDTERLNDGQWHHIAITMKEKSCLLSEVKIFINGSLRSTSSHGDDYPIFFYTSGSISLGGWGYSHPDHEKIFPDLTPYTGSMDEFFLWGRHIVYDDLKRPMLKKFKRNKNVACDDFPDNARKYVGKMRAKKCRQKCRKNQKCRGYELIPSLAGFECYSYSKRPILGKTVHLAQCNPTV